MIKKLLKIKTGYEFESEFKFHPTRKWRFDYCQTESQTAIEVEGGIFANGRHTRGVGYQKDMEKYNAAIEQGFAVLRFTPQQMKKVSSYEFIKKVVEDRLK